MVERLNGIQEVSGSNPLISTNDWIVWALTLKVSVRFFDFVKVLKLRKKRKFNETCGVVILGPL